MATPVDATATLALTTAVGVFHNFLPPLTDVRRIAYGQDYSSVIDVRVGELASVGLVVGIGAVLASLNKSHLPLTLSLIAAGGLVFIYEYALRNNDGNAKL